ncbi:efflux RND transporter permease subunit [bacterium]|nr:efflux RND transporter permease subunit [bacterium]
MADKDTFREAFLPRLSVRRPISILMIFCALLLVGAIAYVKLPIPLMPSGFDPPFLYVWVSYRYSNPAEIEEQITRPFEEQLRTVRHLKDIYSSSESNGGGFWLEFEKNTDMDVAYNQVYDRLERARAEMPDDQRYYWIWRFSEDDDETVYFGVNIKGNHDDLHYLCEERIKRPLERIDGVAKVEVWGVYEKVIQVELDPARAAAHGVDLYDLVQTLYGDNFALSSGWVKDGGRKLFVRSIGRYKDLDDVRNLPVKGPNVLLQHVANVKFDVPERTWYRRLNREPAVSVGVYKESTANTVDLCKRVVKAIDEDLKNDPAIAGWEFEMLFNQGEFIIEAIDNLKSAGLWGAFFAFWVLYFFLRHWRMTMIVILAIPMSLLATIIFLYFSGWTLNLMTLMGLMISVGLVVDNAIVITEGIFLRKTMGDKGDVAAIRGASEVSLAVTMATLTTVVVFLPLILMNDDVGFAFYMARIGMPVVAAIVASLIVALLIIPLATRVLIKDTKLKSSRLLDKMAATYQKSLTWVMSHRFDMTVVALLLFAFTQGYIISKVPKTDMAEGNINDFRLRFELPENYTIEKAEALVTTVEDLLYEKAEVYDLRAIDTRYSRTWASVRAYLNPSRDLIWWRVTAKAIGSRLGLWKSEKMTREEVLEEMKERVPELPGVEMFVNWRWDPQKDSAVQLTLYGDDTGTLLTLAREVKKRFQVLPGVAGVELDLENGADELRIKIDRELAMRYNLDPAQVASTISYALRGYELPDFHSDDREIPMRTQLAKEERETLEQLRNLTFYTESGTQIPLAAAADFQITKGWDEIRRHNGKTSLQMNIFTTQDNMEALEKTIDGALAGIQFPRGYTIGKGNRFSDMEESNQAQQFGVIMAIVFVFLLMGVLFESFILPISVIVAVPFSFIGAYWMLFLTNTALDLMAGIGLIILIGIVVNNAIVLVDLINRLRKQGMSQKEAIIEAGNRRFRPILMTALTTICGLLPMAMGNAALIGIPYAPLGRTIIGGLISATFLTLFMVPITYSYFDDLRQYMKNFSRRIFGTRRSAA